MVNENSKIFSYSYTPSCGFYEEDDGGFEIEINLDGYLTYTTYYFDRIEKSSTSYPLSSTTIEQINKIIIKNKKKIYGWKPKLDNGSLDGFINEFIFLDKQIISFNIQHSDLLTLFFLLFTNPNYLITYLTNLKHENEVICLFNLITNKLKKDRIELSLDKFQFYE